MLTIWGRLNSHNVKKVVWLAEEMGLSYDRRDVGGAFGMDAAYRALNPNGLIPTIDDNGFVLWESNAILRYLAASHGGEAFYPVDPQARASVERWMDWGFTWADAIRPIFFQMVRTTADQRDTALVGGAWRERRVFRRSWTMCWGDRNGCRGMRSGSGTSRLPPMRIPGSSCPLNGRRDRTWNAGMRHCRAVHRSEMW